MTVPDLRIANAEVVLPDGVRKVDLLVDDGVITDIVEPSDPATATEVLDASGLHVFPGVVDPHVHLGPNITFPQSPDDVVPETQSALAGGVTTMVAYLMSAQPYHDVMPVARETMSAHSATDFGFHFCIVTREQLEAIPDYAKSVGVSSFKFFMNFRGEEGHTSDCLGTTTASCSTCWSPWPRMGPCWIRTRRTSSWCGGCALPAFRRAGRRSTAGTLHGRTMSRQRR